MMLASGTIVNGNHIVLVGKELSCPSCCNIAEANITVRNLTVRVMSDNPGTINDFCFVFVFFYKKFETSLDAYAHILHLFPSSAGLWP